MKLATIIGSAVIAAGLALGVLLAEYVCTTGAAHSHREDPW